MSGLINFYERADISEWSFLLSSSCNQELLLKLNIVV